MVMMIMEWRGKHWIHDGEYGVNSGYVCVGRGQRVLQSPATTGRGDQGCVGGHDGVAAEGCVL